VEPISSKAHERLGDTGDESREGVRSRFAEGESCIMRLLWSIFPPCFIRSSLLE